MNESKKEGDKMRAAEVSRITGETKIYVYLNLDGTGKSEIATGIGFFDHMLNNFARHGLFDLVVKCNGDLDVDCHHTIEDVGIALGEAILRAVGDKKGIRRYGSAILPMDESLFLCAVDLCGRPYFVFRCDGLDGSCGDFDAEMAKEFFYAISYSARMNLHIKKIEGENRHHMIECMFKAFAKSLMQAVSVDGRIVEVLSTKGVL